MRAFTAVAFVALLGVISADKHKKTSVSGGFGGVHVSLGGGGYQGGQFGHALKKHHKHGHGGWRFGHKHGQHQ